MLYLISLENHKTKAYITKILKCQRWMNRQYYHSKDKNKDLKVNETKDMPYQELSHRMEKPTICIDEKQRRRSASQ